MIKLNDKYYNLIEKETFIISEGPLERKSFNKENATTSYYKILWEDGFGGNWIDEDSEEWLQDEKLNIKVKDDIHLLSLRLKYSDKVVD